MAVVPYALASYVQNMLMEMINDEVHMLLGVPKEIDNVRVKLDDLKNFLADADRRNITGRTVQTWVTELRGTMYDATDIIDFCRLKAMDRGPSWDMGCFIPFLFCMQNPIQTHHIGRRIKNLNKKLSDIKMRADVNPMHLMLDCSLSLLTCIAAGKSGPGWNKFRHIQQVKAHADDEGIQRKQYVL